MPPPLTLTIAVRSVVFQIWVWGLGLFLGLPATPLLLGPRRGALMAVRLWARLVIWGFQAIVGCRVEVRGRPPVGAALIAAKHQGMFDIIPPFQLLNDPCLVMKSELMRVPIFGWFAQKLEMIVVDREAAAKALRAMVAEAGRALADGRQILIFPEGTRKAPGAAPDYKPGVAGLYRELGLPCVPLATNSGCFWPPSGLWVYPGVAVFEFLPPIEAGLKRASFMARLEAEIEAASQRLLSETQPR